jgi:hypothetical protein
MSKTRSQMRYVGQWPDGYGPSNHPAELTVAARRLAASALEELNRLGVTVELDKAGRAHFRAKRIPPPAARLTIERQGDLIETYLIERKVAGIHGKTDQGPSNLDPPKYSQWVSSAFERPVHPCVHPERRDGYECEPSNL